MFFFLLFYGTDTSCNYILSFLLFAGTKSHFSAGWWLCGCLSATPNAFRSLGEKWVRTTMLNSPSQEAISSASRTYSVSRKTLLASTFGRNFFNSSPQRKQRLLRSLLSIFATHGERNNFPDCTSWNGAGAICFSVLFEAKLLEKANVACIFFNCAHRWSACALRYILIKVPGKK